MSTLTSADIGELKRPSTRVHAPPGGGSSWSIGGSDVPVPSKSNRAPPSPIKKPALSNDAPRTPEKNVASNSAVATPERKISRSSVAIVRVKGDDNIVGKLVENCTARVNELGSTCSLFTVNSLQELPCAAKRIANEGKFQSVVCLGFLPESHALFNSLSSALIQGLMSVSISAECPVIPGVVFGQAQNVTTLVNGGYGGEWIDSALNLSMIGSGISRKASSESRRPSNTFSSPVRSTQGSSTVTIGHNVIPEEFSRAPVSVREILDRLRASLAEHGARGIVGLSRKFRIMDDDGNRTLCLSEFKKAIAEHCLEFSDHQIKELFDWFDKDNSGTISYDEFLIGIRGELNERRKQLVLMAFDVIDVDKSGVIELDDIIARYKADKHPDVISGKKTKNEVFREFLDTFDGGEKDGKVHPDEFIRYYANCSASIDDDDYFELMIRNAWHISGGKGWCENSTCRRVLVTHEDGRQTVEEVKNDIGIQGDNKDAIHANLSSQGIKAKSFEPHGSVEVKNEPVANARPQTTPGRRRQHGAGESSIVFG